MVDTQDLKYCGFNGRAGSIPAPGTKLIYPSDIWDPYISPRIMCERVYPNTYPHIPLQQIMLPLYLEVRTQVYKLHEHGQKEGQLPL